MFTEIFYVPEVTGKLVNLSSDFLKKNKINICLEVDKFEFHGESVPINSCLQKQVVAEPTLSGIKEELT